MVWWHMISGMARSGRDLWELKTHPGFRGFIVCSNMPQNYFTIKKIPKILYDTGNSKQRRYLFVSIKDILLAFMRRFLGDKFLFEKSRGPTFPLRKTTTNTNHFKGWMHLPCPFRKKTTKRNETKRNETLGIDTWATSWSVLDLACRWDELMMGVGGFLFSEGKNTCSTYYLDLPFGVLGVSKKKHHPLGFKEHPLMEDAGRRFMMF